MDWWKVALRVLPYAERAGEAIADAVQRRREGKARKARQRLLRAQSDYERALENLERAREKRSAVQDVDHGELDDT